MNFGGDYVTESDEPLLRAEDGDKYTALNVFRTEKGKAGAVEEKYAYGLFKNKENVSIDVVTGFTYRFESTILIERDDKLFVNENNHAQPFQINSDHNLMGSNKSYHADKLDNFQYASPDQEDSKREYMHQLKYGEAYIDAGEDLPARYGAAWYPRVGRYYGTFDSFDPGLSENVEIEMVYKCFGLKFDVVSLPSGTITVEDITMLDAITDKEPKQKLIFPKGLELSNDKKEWEGTFSMNDLLGDSEKFNLKFTWHKGGSVTETFTNEITVKPKTRKVLRININGSPNYEVKGNISFSMETVDLTDEVQEENQNFE